GGKRRREMTTWIGVDVSKNTLDVCAHEGESRTFRQPEQLAEAIAFITAFDAPSVVMEATGGYEVDLFEALGQADVRCSVVNPAHAFAFRKSLGKHAKTDAIDARLLTRMGVALEPAQTPLPSSAQRKLECLMLRRAQLMKMQTAEKARKQQHRDRDAKKSVARMAAFLRK